MVWATLHNFFRRLKDVLHIFDIVAPEFPADRLRLHRMLAMPSAARPTRHLAAECRVAKRS
jgi:hypothetical protein